MAFQRPFRPILGDFLSWFLSIDESYPRHLVASTQGAGRKPPQEDSLPVNNRLGLLCLDTGQRSRYRRKTSSIIQPLEKYAPLSRTPCYR